MELWMNEWLNSALEHNFNEILYSFKFHGYFETKEQANLITVTIIYDD